MVLINRADGFKIDQILLCGQCFRYKQLEEQHYEVFAKNQRIRIKQNGNDIEFDCDEDRFNQVWRDYFDLETNYYDFLEPLIMKDEYLAKAYKEKSGLRLLKQDPFEMMISFILSQNKSIPQIMVLIERLSEKYGTEVEDQYGRFFAFPTPEQLAEADETMLRALKVGFRAPYIVDAVKHVVDGTLNLDDLYDMTKDEARDQLMAVKGIGKKVADCILLFGYGKWDVFPVDVWVRRLMIENYFEGEKVSDAKILAFASEYFGSYSGLAQQYLFYYRRDKK